MSTTSTMSADTWRHKLSTIVETMRDMSRHTDPQKMVHAYAERMHELSPIDRRISLSRRGLSYPHYRITRSTTWTEDINPWLEPDRLPLLRGGLLADLHYADQPRVFDDLEIDPSDPAAEYLAGHRSVLAIPMYDNGVALNMVVLMRTEPFAFPADEIPDIVWRTSLFGRATSNLVLKAELQCAYQALDQELKLVGHIQRALLPARLPRIETMDLAANYQPAHRAGGDYYDFFPLPQDQWGIFIADVSGHGIPAAVLMAVTHCIAHTHPGPPMPPGQVLAYLNAHLTTRYAHLSEMFVTAWYGIYDPATRRLRYACAGHNAPRVKRCQDGSLMSLDGVTDLPLGIMPDSQYADTVQQLQTGDQIVFYTDGITEAHNPEGQQFGTARLDRVLENCSLQARSLLEAVIQSVNDFARGHPAEDDRTIIVARIC